jgi:hypothetical protein
MKRKRFFQCCGSCFLYIPDPGSENRIKREGRKKLVFAAFFVTTNFIKLKNYIIFELVTKIIWANLHRITVFPDPDPQHWIFHGYPFSNSNDFFVCRPVRESERVRPRRKSDSGMAVSKTIISRMKVN